MSFCHCVYKIYYRSFAFSVLKNYVIVIYQQTNDSKTQ